jgi:hypothetical protein
VKAKPPRKRAGQATGRRLFNGHLLDVASGAAFLGGTEKQLRAWVDRRAVPFKRLGGRVVFLKAELEAFLVQLDGCGVDEAIQNLAARGEAADGDG